jgi:hypothetical protein
VTHKTRKICRTEYGNLLREIEGDLTRIINVQTLYVNILSDKILKFRTLNDKILSNKALNNRVPNDKILNSSTLNNKALNSIKDTTADNIKPTTTDANSAKHRPPLIYHQIQQETSERSKESREKEKKLETRQKTLVKKTYPKNCQTNHQERSQKKGRR